MGYIRKTYMSRYYLFLCIFFSITSNAQSFSGRVFDENNEPLLGAAVYFDGTTVGVVSNRDGYFEIKIPQNLYKPTLVISYLGYKNLFIKNISKSNKNYRLERSRDVLDDVDVTASGFSRQEMEKAFKTHFLGNVPEAKYCNILNMEDILLYYRGDDNTFHAKTRKPIIIENEYLGYRIKYDLEDFFVQFNIKSLDHIDYKRSILSGRKFFEDIDNSKRRNRQLVYDGSLNMFFKSLFDKTNEDRAFKMRIWNKTRSAQEVFELEELKDNTYRVHLKKEFVKYKNGEFKPLDVWLKFIKRNNRKERSTIKFMKPYCIIDANGFNLDRNILIKDDLTKYKVARMLPENFGD